MKNTSELGAYARQYLDALYPKHGVLFTWIEVATMIRKHEQSVRRYLADGRLKRYTGIIGHNAVTREDLIAFIMTKYRRDFDRASYFVQEVEAQYRAHEARLRRCMVPRMTAPMTATADM